MITVLQSVLVILLILIISFFDYLTGAEISFSIFYLIPVIIVTWYSGKRNGVIISVLCAWSWFSTELLTAKYTNSAVLIWNTMVRLSFFLIISLILSKLQEYILKMKDVVLELQESLLKEKEISEMK